jgi:hypothetical protein
MVLKQPGTWYDKAIRGALGMSLALLIVFAVLVHLSDCGVRESRREMLAKSRCGRRLQDIAAACFLYQDEYGSLPTSLGDLISAGYTDPEATEFRSKRALRSDRQTEGAVFTVRGVGPEVVVRQEGGRFEVVGSPFSIVARSPVTRTDHEPLLMARLKGWRAILYANNHFEWYAVEEAPPAASARRRGASLRGPLTAKPAPMVPEGLRWKYLVEVSGRGGLLGAEPIAYTVRAYVHLGAGAELAGGQFAAEPAVVYIDETGDRLKGKKDWPQTPVLPGTSERYRLSRDLVDGIPGEAWSTSYLACLYYLLPTAPEEVLREGLGWQATVPVSLATLPVIRFPLGIEHRVGGTVEKEGRKCWQIDHTFQASFDVHDHPEMFSEQDLRDFRLKMTYSGKGTAYVAVDDGIVVEKTQETRTSVRGQEAWPDGQGGTRWEPYKSMDTHYVINVRLVSSEEAEPAGEQEAPDGS